MKDEIKEILDRLERIDHKEYIAFEFADSATFNEVARCFEERKKMADYITNLQEKSNNQAEEINRLYKQREKFMKKYGYLKEENERLKGLCDKYEEEHSTTFNEWKETITNKYQTLKDLQEEVEDLRRIFGIWNNRKLINKFNKEYDKEDKNKNPNRNYVAIYPDAEEVYKRYYDYKLRNEKAKSLTNRTIEIIKQQPSGNDEWILERLNGINYCLGGDEE